MSRKEELSKIEFAIIYIIFGMILLFQYKLGFSYTEKILFAELILTYFWMTGLFVYAKFKYNIKVFEPITIITIIYEGIFIIKPIIDLHNQSMVEHGISVIGGGFKATFCFAIGYTVFYCSYFLKHRKIVWRGKAIVPTISYVWGKKSIKWMYVIWIIVYVLCIYCMLTQGLSLRYIFSFGSEGVRYTDESNTALLFLSNLGITLITLWLMILEYSTSYLIKAIITFFCIIYLLMRNARWLMFVFILSPIVLYYLKKGKQPNILRVLFVGVLGLTVFAWMQENRAVLASGGAIQGWGVGGFTLEKLLAPLESDLSTYRTFYSMIERFPSEYSYMLGKTFLYTLILFIPRAIWSGKPDNPVRDMIEHSLNERARVSGTAVANIGEFYANFGIIGIIIFMYILGWIASSMKHFIFERLEKSEDPRNYYIIYSIIYPLFFQWIARGNFSGNLYMTIFAILPIIIFEFLKKVRG